MTRYKAMFERCAHREEGVFGGFLMLGDPDPEASAAYLDAIIEGGADMVEVGIPFSDPIADGPVIQAAAGRALRAGVRTSDCFNLIAGFRARHPDVPLGVLTYANIVAARGITVFVSDLAAVGADSLLVADVPSLEATPYAAAATSAGLDLVMIAATNTPRDVLNTLASLSSGYTYCVARAGVTGADEHLSLNHGALFASLKAVNAPPPVLGFGISKPEHVREALDAGAAGAIAGSAIVRLIEAGASADAVQQMVATLKSSTRLLENQPY
jgi:tryptophan synthase alpha chain